MQLCRQKRDDAYVIIKEIPVEEMSLEERTAALNEVSEKKEEERRKKGETQRIAVQKCAFYLRRCVSCGLHHRVVNQTSTPHVPFYRDIVALANYAESCAYF